MSPLPNAVAAAMARKETKQATDWRLEDESVLFVRDLLLLLLLFVSVFIIIGGCRVRCTAFAWPHKGTHLHTHTHILFLCESSHFYEGEGRRREECASTCDVIKIQNFKARSRLSMKPWVEWEIIFFLSSLFVFVFFALSDSFCS